MNMSSQKSRRSDKVKIDFPLITNHMIYSRVMYVIYMVVSIVVEIEYMAVIQSISDAHFELKVNQINTNFNNKSLI